MSKFLVLILIFTSFAKAKASSLDDLSRQVFAKVDRNSVFIWRQKTLSFDLGYVDRVEYNNFTSQTLRLGIRKPFNAYFIGGDISYITVSSTSAANALEDTAYRQYGKPDRLNFGLTGDFVLLEGIASKYWSFIPEMQFLLSFSTRFGIDVYTQAMGDFSSIFQSEISTSLANELLESAPEGMIIDKRKFDLGLGFRLDAYQRSGLGLYFRWYATIPLGALPEGTGRVSEISFGVQYAY